MELNQSGPQSSSGFGMSGGVVQSSPLLFGAGLVASESVVRRLTRNGTWKRWRWSEEANVEANRAASVNVPIAPQRDPGLTWLRVTEQRR